MSHRISVRSFAPLAAILVTIALARPAGAQAYAPSVTVNGSQVALSPGPIIRDGRIFVPLRGVFEQLGASVDYADGRIDATGNGREIELQIGSNEATVNQQRQTIDVAPFIVGASTYVPLRFISESLGDSVSWDEGTQAAAIDTGGGGADYYAPGTASYVDTAPPPIPAYDQPPAPAPDVIWQPGYWAWGAYGYYWIPGTWVRAPQPGYLWTPGYWRANDAGFNWNPGYWALAVGFYGGVNYGAGYFGNGYDGGRWSHDRFVYNTYVTHVNTTVIRNVYIDRTAYVDRSTTHISYNGGRGGIRAVPSVQQAAVAHQRHVGMTTIQQQHVREAEQNRAFLLASNHGKPPVPAIAHPLSATNRPAGFVPVTAADRIDPQANVVPVRIAKPTRVARPATHPLTLGHNALPGTPASRPVTNANLAPHVTHVEHPITHVALPVPHVVPPLPHLAPAVTHAAPRVYQPVLRNSIGEPGTSAVRLPAVHAAPLAPHTTRIPTTTVVHPLVKVPPPSRPVRTLPVHPHVAHPPNPGRPERP